VPSSVLFTFAISASYTAEPIEPVLRFWGGPLQVDFRCAFAPFNQLIQTILDPGSVFAANKHGLNVLLYRAQDLGAPKRRQENLEALAEAVSSRAAQLSSPILIVPDTDPGALFRDLPSVYVLTPSQVDHWYPTRQKYSGQGDQLGAIPYTDHYYIALGSAIARSAHAILKAPHKVLALDCDDTLWKGICGEDGPEGVTLTEGHRSLQEFALKQRQAGMLITLNSKNNEADVRETFERHPEFPLKWRDITATRINWSPKTAGLSSLASELSLGLDSFIFLDDNPKEVSEVDEQLPQVLGLSLPAEGNIGRFLDHVWAFDRLKVTSADASRAASYQGVQEFGKALHEASSLEGFYSTLDLEVTIRPVSGEEIERASQLTQRTNQFNFTTIRRSEAEIQSLLQAGVDVFGVHVKDRFGDYGFTGLVIGRKFNEDYLIDTALLSCRVLGRGVEHKVFAWIGEHALKLGAQHVEIPFQPSARNAPAEEFWKSLPLRPRADQLAATRFVPNREPGLVSGTSKPEPAQHSVDYGYIAAHLDSVSNIRRRMRQHQHIELETATETRLAAMWQDLLECEAIAGSSNFFDLGGHSLKVVLLLMRIQEDFQVSLGIEDVYAADVTLERMARRIDELVAFGGVGHNEYTRILQTIEAMSEEEALIAWNEESGANAHSVSR
jgi:FkbH-like protein